MIIVRKGSNKEKKTNKRRKYSDKHTSTREKRGKAIPITGGCLIESIGSAARRRIGSRVEREREITILCSGDELGHKRRLGVTEGSKRTGEVREPILFHVFLLFYSFFPLFSSSRRLDYVFFPPKI